jgi:hypothetical protein
MVLTGLQSRTSQKMSLVQTLPALVDVPSTGWPPAMTLPLARRRGSWGMA